MKEAFTIACCMKNRDPRNNPPQGAHLGKIQFPRGVNNATPVEWIEPEELLDNFEEADRIFVQKIEGENAEESLVGEDLAPVGNLMVVHAAAHEPS